MDCCIENTISRSQNTANKGSNIFLVIHLTTPSPLKKFQ